MTLFDSIDRPRVFGMPLGVDFAGALVEGIRDRLQDTPPHEIAKVEIFLNTRRMQRRVKQLFDVGGATLLPRLRLVTDLARDAVGVDVPQPVSSLRRRLELSQFVARLLQQEPDLAPRSALFDLSDSLANLLDEMHGEGVPLDAILDLDVSDRSGHWERTQKFIGIVQPFFDLGDQPPDTETRQRMVIERQIALWDQSPPDHPVIVAGSTGSRGTTLMLMEAVAKLPQGAIILPGVDYDMDEVWPAMTDRRRFEDHPQYRYKILMDRLGLEIGDIPPWTGFESNPRNRVVSLSLRPAPVTDQWLTEGPALGDLPSAMADVTLVEAPSPRAEAETIALRLRKAIDDGITAALITPDRTLTRQVAAALDRWNITPDDSAGQPLHLSPPGRLLRHVAGLRIDRITGETLLSTLKHPLVASGSDRGRHILWTHELELQIRKEGPAFPTGDALRDLKSKNDDHRAWLDWIASVLDQVHKGAGTETEVPLADHLSAHLSLTEMLAQGPTEGADNELWKQAAGREALRVMKDLELQADAAGAITARDYGSLMSGVLSGAEVRNPDESHPQVLFWGTLEARVQSADLVILGGMNDGVWPKTPQPDP